MARSVALQASFTQLNAAAPSSSSLPDIQELQTAPFMQQVQFGMELTSLLGDRREDDDNNQQAAANSNQEGSGGGGELFAFGDGPNMNILWEEARKAEGEAATAIAGRDAPRAFEIEEDYMVDQGREDFPGEPHA